MDIFKKIYTVIIILTIIAFTYLSLATLGAIKIDISSETQVNIVAIMTYVIIMSIVFSRSANVIANRQSRAVGYIATFIGLADLLLLTLQLMIENEALTKITSVFSVITIFIMLIVLVFEVPQANTMHGRIQKIVAGIIAITFIFPYVTGLRSLEKQISINSVLGNNRENSAYEEVTKKSAETLQMVENVLTILSLAGFIINPMLRVYYIDNDYTALQELEETFRTANRYVPTNNEPNPNAILSEKYRKPEVQSQQPPIIPVYIEPTVVDAQPITYDGPQEKIINQKFQEEVHPDAIIPSIDGLNIESTPQAPQTPQVPTEQAPQVPTEQTPQVPTEQTPQVPTEQTPQVPTVTSSTTNNVQ